MGGLLTVLPVVGLVGGLLKPVPGDGRGVAVVLDLAMDVVMANGAETLDVVAGRLDGGRSFLTGNARPLLRDVSDTRSPDLPPELRLSSTADPVVDGVLEPRARG